MIPPPCACMWLPSSSGQASPGRIASSFWANIVAVTRTKDSVSNRFSFIITFIGSIFYQREHPVVSRINKKFSNGFLLALNSIDLFSSSLGLSAISLYYLSGYTLYLFTSSIIIACPVSFGRSMVKASPFFTLKDFFRMLPCPSSSYIVAV